MKSLAFACLVLLLSGGVLAQSNTPHRTPDSLQAEFDSIATRWLAAYNGADARQLEPLYTEDAQYI